MTKETYLEFMRFFIVYVLLINVTLVWQFTNHFNNISKIQNEVYLEELNKMQLTIDKNLGATMIQEHIIVRYEEIPIEEFAVSKDIPLSDHLQEFIYYVCKMYNIDYKLVLSIISIESGFNIDIISSNGHDYGLMQINKINHERLQNILSIGSDFLNPYSNVIAGCFMLNESLEGATSYNEMLMVYNLGKSGANKLFNQEIFSTSYVDKVKEKYEYYGGTNHNMWL